MDIVGAILDSANVVAEKSGDREKAFHFLNISAATEVMNFTECRKAGVPAEESAKSLFNAAWCFLSAAALSGLDIEASFAEILRQAEGFAGSEYLDEDERLAARKVHERAAARQFTQSVNDIFSRRTIPGRAA